MYVCVCMCDARVLATSSFDCVFYRFLQRAVVTYFVTLYIEDRNKKLYEKKYTLNIHTL